MDHDQDESQSFGYNGSTAGYLIITLLSLSKLYFYDIREKMLKTGQNLSKIGQLLSRNAQLGCLFTFSESIFVLTPYERQNRRIGLLSVYRTLLAVIIFQQANQL